MNPYISIIIPAYNEEDKIKDTLESTGFQSQTDSLFQIEHQVHVMNRLSAGAFQQIVDTRDNQ